MRTCAVEEIGKNSVSPARGRGMPQTRAAYQALRKLETGPYRLPGTAQSVPVRYRDEMRDRPLRRPAAPRLLLLCGLVVAAGCSASPKRAAPAAPSPPPSHSQRDRDRARAGAPSAAPGAPVTRAECDKLIDHVIAIARAEQAARLPANKRPTDAQVDAIRRGLRRDLMQPCLRAGRAQLTCGMAASTSRALARCYAPPRAQEPGSRHNGRRHSGQTTGSR